MNDINTCNNWYALFVMTGKEDILKERLQYRLRDKNLRVIVPKRRLREKKTVYGNIS